MLNASFNIAMEEVQYLVCSLIFIDTFACPFACCQGWWYCQSDKQYTTSMYYSHRNTQLFANYAFTNYSKTYAGILNSSLIDTGGDCHTNRRWGNCTFQSVYHNLTSIPLLTGPQLPCNISSNSLVAAVMLCWTLHSELCKDTSHQSNSWQGDSGRLIAANMI